MKSYLLLLVFCATTMAQTDSSATIGDMPGGDSLSKITLMAPKDTIAKDNGAVRADSLVKSTGVDAKELVNIVLTDKKIRATGWGEYRVGGHCLCCDNMKSVDCITVQTTNRTDKLRLKQLIDGKTEADRNDNATYFGDLYERDAQTKPVVLLMAEIVAPKQQDIHRVIVYGIADSLRKKNVPFNCELGYIDQFDRLQWAGKVENSGHEDRIVFDLKNPIFTKDIFLKVKDGRNIITEVAIFAEKKKE